MLFDATIYYLWAFGSDLPGLRLTVGFVGIQLFPADSRLHRFGVVSVPGAVPGWFCGNGKTAVVKDFNSCN